MASKKKKSYRNTPEPLAEYELAELEYKPSIAQRFTEDQVKQAVEESHGITWRILKRLDCTYPQWAVYTSEHREVAQLQKTARQELVAEAERTLDECLKNGSEKTKMEAAKYILSKLGREEGWGEDQPCIAVDVSDADKQTRIRAVFGLGSSGD